MEICKAPTPRRKAMIKVFIINLPDFVLVVDLFHCLFVSWFGPT